MGALYYSNEVQAGSGVQARALHAGVFALSGVLDLSKQIALVATDVVQMVKVPIGFRPHLVILDCPDMDTTTNLTLSVGDGDSTARYISANTVGQAGGKVVSNLAGSSGKVYAAEDTIDLLVAAGPATAVTGKVYLTVLGSMDVPAV